MIKCQVSLNKDLFREPYAIIEGMMDEGYAPVRVLNQLMVPVILRITCHIHCFLYSPIHTNPLHHLQ